MQWFGFSCQLFGVAVIGNAENWASFPHQQAQFGQRFLMDALQMLCVANETAATYGLNEDKKKANKIKPETLKLRTM